MEAKLMKEVMLFNLSAIAAAIYEKLTGKPLVVKVPASQSCDMKSLLSDSYWVIDSAGQYIDIYKPNTSVGTFESELMTPKKARERANIFLTELGCQEWWSMLSMGYVVTIPFKLIAVHDTAKVSIMKYFQELGYCVKLVGTNLEVSIPD